MRNDNPWIFPFLVGLMLGLVVGYWDTISSLWTHRQQLSGLGKISEGISELGQ